MSGGYVYLYHPSPFYESGDYVFGIGGCQEFMSFDMMPIDGAIVMQLRMDDYDRARKDLLTILGNKFPMAEDITQDLFKGDPDWMCSAILNYQQQLTPRYRAFGPPMVCEKKIAPPSQECAGLAIAKPVPKCDSKTISRAAGASDIHPHRPKLFARVTDDDVEKAYEFFGDVIKSGIAMAFGFAKQYISPQTVAQPPTAARPPASHSAQPIVEPAWHEDHVFSIYRRIYDTFQEIAGRSCFVTYGQQIEASGFNFILTNETPLCMHPREVDFDLLIARVDSKNIPCPGCVDIFDRAVILNTIANLKPYIKAYMNVRLKAPNPSKYVALKCDSELLPKSRRSFEMLMSACYDFPANGAHYLQEAQEYFQF